MTQPDADVPTDPPTESAGTDPATPAVEELLAGLADDYSLRLRRGERPPAEEYAQKHPELAVRIREMLAAIALIEESRPFDAKAAGDVPGTLVGRYKLLERIGEGGFGVVFMAEQQFPVRRRVAVKLIKAGLDTKQVIARFDAERQALAMMDHPNIAKVHDAGATETGRPYFVMELVPGVPITEYCDANRLSPRQRLELFIPVCRAVQHAHTKGIIHRDIKPTNVLVTMHDGVPVPKVIDFGVAKATGQQPLTDATLFTQFAQMVGTPLYMSPEQAEMSGLDVDTRSDVYSLGVLLYELLTGTTPFDKERLRQAAHDEVRRIIREEEPPRPSTRISTMLGEKLATVSADRKTEPRRLGQLVRGELDWIVMRALEKDRARRYETANGLAADVLRYLRNEAVQACPPSAFYRFGKALRRNKLTFAAACAVTLSLVIGLGVSTWLFVKEKDARRLAVLEKQNARTEARKSERVAAFMTDMLQGVGPSVARGRDTRMLREVLDRTAQRLSELRDEPAVEADLRGTLADVYAELGQYPEAAAMARESLRLRKTLLGNEHPEFARSVNDLAQVLYRQGRYAEAESLHREALAIRKKCFGSEHPDVASSLNNLAEALSRQRQEAKTAEAEPLFREALAMRRKLLGDVHEDVADSLNDLGMLLRANRRLVEAEAAHREALAIRKKVFGSEHTDVASSLDRVGLMLLEQRKYADAEAFIGEAVAMGKRLFGSEHPDLGHSIYHYGQVFNNQGRRSEAEPFFREVLAMRKKLLGNDHSDVADTQMQLARNQLEQGKFAEAELLLREALPTRRKAGPGGHLNDTIETLGSVLRAQGKVAEADALAREAQTDEERRRADAIEACRGSLRKQPDSPDLHRTLGDLLVSQGHYLEAEAAFTQATDLRPTLVEAWAGRGACRMSQRDFAGAVGPYSQAIRLKPDTLWYWHERAYAYLMLQEHQKSIADHSVAIEMDRNNAFLWLRRGMSYEALGDFAKAEPDYSKAIELNEQHYETWYTRARLYFRLGQSEKAQADWANTMKRVQSDGQALNSIAWQLVADPDPRLHRPKEAVELAQKAVAALPDAAHIWNTLGVALYRAGRWNDAIVALERSIDIGKGGNSVDMLFMAMARERAGDPTAATWFDKAILRMKNHRRRPDSEVVRFRAEADELFGHVSAARGTRPTDSVPATAALPQTLPAATQPLSP